MATNFTMPSMFDTRYAMDRQMELDAQNAGQVGGAGKRYGMYYNSSLLGDRDNATLMSLTGMMGGQGDPRMQKQMAIDSIMQQYPNPETVEDFKAISGALRQSGLYEEADRAMSMANDLREQNIKSYEAQTKRMTAINKSKEAPTRDEVDYVKNVNGKDVVYTKTVQYNPSNQQWDFISEAPKYAPDKPTATMQDMMFHASKVQNKDGSVGCNLDEESCWIAATDLYHATAVKEDSFDKEFGESAGKDVAKRYESAKSSVDAINTIDASFNALNSGDPITGFASDMRLGLAKMIGAISGDENKDVQATEVWLATTGKLVADLLASGAFGSGTGLSDNDVKFAKAMQGGDVTLDENSIRRILFMRRQLENKVITNWNETYRSYPNSVKKNMNQFYSDEQIYQAEKPLDPNTVYIKPPKGFFIYPESNSLLGTDEYFWPATEYDVDTVEYNGTRWTVHNKNGIDLTREYIELYNQGQE